MKKHYKAVLRGLRLFSVNLRVSLLPSRRPLRAVRASRLKPEAIGAWVQGDDVIILQDRTRLASTRGYRESLQALLGS